MVFEALLSHFPRERVVLLSQHGDFPQPVATMTEDALRFAEQVGLQREGLLRRHERDPQGRWCDIVILAALNPQPPMD